MMIGEFCSRVVSTAPWALTNSKKMRAWNSPPGASLAAVRRYWMVTDVAKRSALLNAKPRNSGSVGVATTATTDSGMLP